MSVFSASSNDPRSTGSSIQPRSSKSRPEAPNARNRTRVLRNGEEQEGQSQHRRGRQSEVHDASQTTLPAKSCHGKTVYTLLFRLTPQRVQTLEPKGFPLFALPFENTHDDRVGFAHTRLAIIDVDPRANQPMHDSDGTAVIVYNGEVYNFRELRRELEAAGHVFRTTSDTESILLGYKQWGADVVRRLRGMFALAIWDRARQELLLARDRMGQKPLYYGWLGSNFCFASELKAIRALDNRGELQIDHNAVAAYLRFLYVPAPLSIYENIYKLIPGTILTVPLDGGVAKHEFDPNVSKSRFSPR